MNKTVIKDAVTHRICEDLDMETMNSRPVVLFINGEYWGMYGIRDRLGSFHLSDLTGMDEDEINVLVHGSGIRPDFPTDWGIIDGDNANYIDLMNFISENDMNIEANYIYVSSELDISSTIDYYCAEIFFNNFDWIKNNIKTWNTNQPNSKWRWLFYDIDGGWGNMSDNYNLLQKALSPIQNDQYNPVYSTMLLRNLMESEVFKNEFIGRMACLLQNEFSSENIQEKVDEYKAIIDPGISEHIDRWQRPNTVSQWNGSVSSVLQDFGQVRQQYIIDHFENQFQFEFDITSFNCKEIIDTTVVDTTVVDTVNTGFNYNRIFSSFNIYPSPAKEVLYIDYPESISVDRVEIYSSTNQLVYSERQKSRKVNLINFSSGLYYIRFYSDGRIFNKKFVKLD